MLTQDRPKALPDGAFFDLNDAKRVFYLHHRSELGEFFLSSDSALATFTRWGFAKEHPELYTDEDNVFIAIAYTIGGMMVFPGNRIDGKQTINQARGCLRKISDRLDLTLECVRRHYEGQSSEDSEVPLYRMDCLLRELDPLNALSEAGTHYHAR